MASTRIDLPQLGPTTGPINVNVSATNDSVLVKGLNTDDDIQTLRLSNDGVPNGDGVYDAFDNTRPNNVGVIAHERATGAGNVQQTLRLTGINNGTNTSLDTSMHDASGTGLTSTNNTGKQSLDVNVSNTVPVSQSGTWNINNVTGTVSLPTGAATAARQDTGNASLSSIDGKVSTAAKQDTGNSSLASIDGKVSTAAKQDTGNTSLSSIDGKVATATKQDTGNTSLASIDGKMNSLGQKTMAASMPVVIASNQTSIPVAGDVASAATDSGNPVKIAGVYTSSAPTFTSGQRTNIQTDVKGSLYVDREGRRRTYSACTSSLAIASAATDFFTLTGANGVTARVEAVRVIGRATNNSVTTITLIKRSTANTGGTSTAVTAVPHDSSDAAASCAVAAYTANPTLGATVGNVRSTALFLSGASGNTAQEWDIDFDFVSGKNPRLNSSSEVLALNFGAATVAGANLIISVTWSEE